MKQLSFQRTNIHRDFDLAFGRNPFTNDVSKKTDINSINQSLKMLFNTSYYERPFRPEVGSNVRRLLFEPVDSITILDLRAAVEEVIINYEPRINVRSITIKDMEESNAYNVNLVYTINTTKEVQEITLTLKRLR